VAQPQANPGDRDLGRCRCRHPGRNLVDQPSATDHHPNGRRGM